MTCRDTRDQCQTFCGLQGELPAALLLLLILTRGSTGLQLAIPQFRDSQTMQSNLVLQLH